MVVCVECLPADKPWGVVSATRRSSSVAPRACVRVYARVLVPPNVYIHIHTSFSRSLVGLYKIFVYFKGFVQDRIILFLPLPICIAHTVAILLHDYCCAIYDRPPTPRLYAIHHTQLGLAISCKSQLAGSRSPDPVACEFKECIAIEGFERSLAT